MSLYKVYVKTPDGRIKLFNNFENNNPFVKAAKNLKNVEFLKADGINVYDILNNEKLVITKDSLNSIVERCQ